MSITTKERFTQIAQQADVPYDVARKVIQATAAQIAQELETGGLVHIPHLGTFRTTLRSARMCHNPVTQQLIHLDAKRRVAFKACKAWKTRLNPEPEPPQAKKTRRAPAKRTATRAKSRKAAVA